MTIHCPKCGVPVEVRPLSRTALTEPDPSGKGTIRTVHEVWPTTVRCPCGETLRVPEQDR